MSQSRREKRKFAKRRARDKKARKRANLRKGGTPYVYGGYFR